MSTATLRLRNVSKAFGGVQLLSSINFAIFPPSRFVGIVGQNGSGKTTLLNIIGGQTKPDPTQDTEVEVLGRSTLPLEPWRVARLGVARLFQNARVFGNLTVEENIAVALQAHRGTLWTSLRQVYLGEKEREVLGKFNILDAIKARADSLSLGKRRRLALAVALSLSPRLLLLDEPTSNLDSEAISELQSALLALPPTTQVLVIEQNHAFLRGLRAECHLLKRGRLHELSLQQEDQR